MRRPARLLAAAIAAAVVATVATIAATVAVAPAPPPSAEGRPTLLAHRGVAQRYDMTGVGNDTCTATRMLPPTHGHLENTLPSAAAGFAAGADVVEIDVHPTTDGHFAVFHDWTLDCRTDGHGVTREHTMAELKALDAGYGYTADGGRTFPFRGRGVRLIPSLDEMLAAFPEGRFLINVKSRDPAEGTMLADALARLPPDRRRLLMVYGGDEPVAAFRQRLPDVPTASRGSLRGCLLRYLAVGWSGTVPDACRTRVVLVPINLAPWLWGWPDRFVARMRAADSHVFAVGPYAGGFTTGIDTPEDLARLPPGYAGGIWTNEIATLARALASGQGRP
ncbi:glycerophosphodiester phosphodiesterase family protein [Azospirillum sp. ST 5-10]|uniref:glycerophosphodiester phosphodiesterase family protein n=1 Tax=unclassified Azospirillum TaxID=2630922 RepID=UPI003F49DAF0